TWRNNPRRLRRSETTTRKELVKTTFKCRLCHEDASFYGCILSSINVLMSSVFCSWKRRTIELPTMTPSQAAPNFFACSLFETPKPANTGTLATSLSDCKYV